MLDDLRRKARKKRGRGLGAKPLYPEEAGGARGRGGKRVRVPTAVVTIL